MKIKPGVEVHDLHPSLRDSLPFLEMSWKSFFPEDTDGALITSGHEGSPTDEHRVHGPSSKHYKQNNADGLGHAIDLRVNDVQQWKAAIWLGKAWELLNINFPNHGWKLFPENFLKESAHIHIQMD